VQVPPEVARYSKGATPETRQFDFLIGDWTIDGTRFRPDGSVLTAYKGIWSARYLNEGRMVLDDFKVLAPTGAVISSFVTLRTYCELTARWEMQGLAALQPAMPVEWYGHWKDGEMLLEAVGKNPRGDTVRTAIRFFDIQPRRFSWESKMSADEGQTWMRMASLEAIRA
jgi:hypothetical protein